jgi:membrane-associated phospholipid phosphatase
VTFVRLAVLSAVLSASAHVTAQPEADHEDRGVEWKEHWPRFHPAEYAATGALIVGRIGGAFAGTRDKANWTAVNGFDDGLRGAFRLTSPGARHAADVVSDALFYALTFYPYVVDANAAWIGHDSNEVAWQMTLINTQSFAFTQVAVMLIKGAAGRERPHVRDCSAGDVECAGDDHSSSFMSGHTSMAFTGAGLICAHHANIPLYGGGIADDLTCVTAMTAATTTGILRVAADRHHASDVLAGAVLGVFSGWLLPNLLHYQFGAEPTDRPDAGVRASFSPLAGPSHIGLSLHGSF